MRKTIAAAELEADARAAQSAIDACGDAGGGQVVLPAGNWHLGDLRLRSGVKLRLAAGFTLAGAVIAEDVEDVAVVGDDRRAVHIDGGVRLVKVRAVECRDYSGRSTSGRFVTDGRFSGLVLHQPPQRQGEGSVVCFEWVRGLCFTDCDLESNDDVFCLKRAAEDVTLADSRLRGRLAAAFKIGTESDGLFRDIRFRDCVIERSDRAAISLESVDGAEICGVEISGIRLRDVNAPLFIRLGSRDRYAKGPGRIRGIVIRDVEGCGEAMDEGYGSCITGLPDRCVEDVTLRDVRFTSRGGQSSRLADRAVAELPELYPEFDMFGRLPAHGLYARHVRGLRLQRVRLDSRLPDGRPAIAFEDVAGAEVVESPEPHVRPCVPPPARPALPARDPAPLVEAIRSARPGQEIVVEAGSYAIPREMLPIVIEADGVTVRSAAGPQATRIEAVGARELEGQHPAAVDPAADMRGDPLFLVQADRVTIAGLTLTGAAYNVYVGGADACTLRGNCFDFSRHHHVSAFRGRGHRIVGNTSRASLNSSVSLQDCRDCLVEGNTFREDPAAVRLAGSCGNVIRGNRFLAVSWDAVSLARGSHDNRVEANVFADGRLTGIQVRQSDRAEIVGNEFRGQKTESVLIDRGSRDVRLRGNSFHSNRGLAVSNETPYPVDAAENWWGSPDGPGPGAEVDANVIVAPWLTEPPPPLPDAAPVSTA